MSEWYKLVGREVIPSPREEWGKNVSTWARVAETYVKHVHISTVFLGLDHAYGGGRPIVFETMVFGGQLDQEQVRYSTYDEAEAGHATMVERVKEAEMSELERKVREVRDGHDKG